MPCAEGVTASQTDVTVEKRRCATALLVQVAGSKANVLGRAVLPLWSGSTLYGVRRSSVGPTSLSKEANIHPIHLWQVPAEDGMICV